MLSLRSTTLIRLISPHCVACINRPLIEVFVCVSAISSAVWSLNRTYVAVHWTRGRGRAEGGKQAVGDEKDWLNACMISLQGINRHLGPPASSKDDDTGSRNFLSSSPWEQVSLPLVESIFRGFCCSDKREGSRQCDHQVRFPTIRSNMIMAGMVACCGPNQNPACG